MARISSGCVYVCVSTHIRLFHYISGYSCVRQRISVALWTVANVVLFGYRCPRNFLNEIFLRNLSLYDSLYISSSNEIYCDPKERRFSRGFSIFFLPIIIFQSQIYACACMCVKNFYFINYFWRMTRMEKLPSSKLYAVKFEIFELPERCPRNLVRKRGTPKHTIELSRNRD